MRSIYGQSVSRLADVQTGMFEYRKFAKPERPRTETTAIVAPLAGSVAVEQFPEEAQLENLTDAN